jgi:hypothetical protein
MRQCRRAGTRFYVVEQAFYAVHRNPVEVLACGDYSSIIPTPLRRICAMNLAKHMEAVLLAALALVAASGIATAAVPALHAPASASAAVVAAPVSGPVQVVTIVGKRQSRL